MRKLRDCRVDKTLQRMFYESVTYSVLSFAMVCWYSSQTTLLSNQTIRIEKKANRIINDGQLRSWDSVYRDKVVKMFIRIRSNADHPLHNAFKQLPSGKRLRAPLSCSKLTDTEKLLFQVPSGLLMIWTLMRE